MENYRTAEKLESILEKNGIPIIPALVFDGKKMQNIDGQFFYLYKWYDGKSLSNSEITEMHCRKIGNTLAVIHNLDKKAEHYTRGEIRVDWDFYTEQLAVKNEELCHLLRKNRCILYEIQSNGNNAVKKLPDVVSVCHNDMDAKNVLWKETDFRIIDLECLGYSSPFIELYELALCWSLCNSRFDGKYQIDYNLFRRFLSSYAEAGGVLPPDWETIYWSDYGRLEWLEYNIKRSLGIQCSAEEVQVGISESKRTISEIAYYYAEKDKIIANCMLVV